METTVVHLHEAEDAEDSFGLTLEKEEAWRAVRGFGQKFRKIWSVELQGNAAPDLSHVDWDVVLERVIEAYDLNDPVITDFHWPLYQTS
jgi:hypothetical protein